MIKMQKGNNIDFDRMVKDLCEDASVKAPRGVWRAVRDEIAPAPFFPVWGRWAVGAACAAAACAIVLFAGIGTESPSDNITISRALEASVAQLACPEIEPAADLREPSRPAKTGFVPSEVKAPEEVADFSAVDAKRSEEKKAEKQAEKAEAGPEASCEDEFFTNPFAEEPVRAKRRGRISIDAGGSVGANDSRIYNGGTTGPRYSGIATPNNPINETSISVYGVPVSFGVGIRFHLTDRFAIGTGIDWSLLTRTFYGSYNTSTGQFAHNAQYIGIPVYAFYDIIKRDALSIYAFGGGSIEKCITNRYYLYSSGSKPVYSEAAMGVQPSAAVGFGVDFKVAPKLAVFVDPSIRYYFNAGQPKTIRTDKPLNITFEAGLRFDL